MLSRIWNLISGKRPLEESLEPPAKRPALPQPVQSDRSGRAEPRVARALSSQADAFSQGQAPLEFYFGGPEAAQFKLLLLGDGNVGKTCFVKRHLTGEFVKKYRPTEGCEMKKLRISTSKGPVLFNVWDTAGQEHLAGLRDGYFIGSKCAIVFFDVSNRESQKNVSQWVTDLRKVTGEIPIVVVGNKVDLPERVVKAQEGSMMMRKLKVQYYDISVKNRLHVEMPLLWLARKLLKDAELRLTSEAAPLPTTPSAPSSMQQRQAELDLRRAASVPVDDDDDF